MKTYTIFEGKEIYDDAIINELKQLVTRFPRLSKFISFNARKAVLENYVGLLQTKNAIIDVLPKVWYKEGSEEKIRRARENFFILFAYAVLEPRFHEPYRQLTLYKGIKNLKDFLTLLFGLSFLENLKKGLYPEYVSEITESKYLRGKLMLDKMLAKPDKSKFTVLQTDLNANNKLNQTFSYVSHAFNDSSLNPPIRQKLFQISFILDTEGIEPKRHSDLSFHFNRLNERFEIPYNYALLLLNESSILPLLNMGEHLKGMMLLFDMNKLFEYFLYKFIDKNWQSIFENINICEPKKLHIWHDKGESNFIIDAESDPKSKRALFETRPDIKIECGNKPILILDAKYKQAEEAIKEHKINDIFKDNMNDLYQMFTYSSLYNCDAVLYYPSVDEKRPKIIGPLQYHSGSNYKLWISTLSLNFDSDWESRLVKGIREDFERILLK